MLDPASPDPTRRPISQIDMALSGGVTRKFVECMVAIDGVPNDAAGANAFLAAHAVPAEITAAQATPAAHRDLWIKAILRIAGPITGPEARDLRVVHELQVELAHCLHPVGGSGTRDSEWHATPCVR